MIEFIDKKTILWDFDGVIINSHAVREQGFREVLSEFPKKDIEELLNYHRKNGGLSRYVKFRYFLEMIRKVEISEALVEEWSSRFSEIMRKKLIDTASLIPETLQFIESQSGQKNMHIISGSDGDELRYLCGKLGLTPHFKTIEGSPVPKINLVKNLVKNFSYHPQDCVLIGDSINDYEAARASNIDFLGYNNPKLEKVGVGYIRSFS